MSQSIHNKIQKIEANIAALELKQQHLKERISHHIIRILDQEQAFAIDPPLLFGTVIDSIQKLKKLDGSSADKTRIKEVGEVFLKRRVPSKKEKS